MLNKEICMKCHRRRAHGKWNTHDEKAWVKEATVACPMHKTMNEKLYIFNPIDKIPEECHYVLEHTVNAD